MENSRNSPITFYYQPNSQRKSEAAFFQALSSRYPHSRMLNEHFLVPQESVDQLIDTRQFFHWLQRDLRLPLKKRLACVEILQSFPGQSMRIACRPSEISFDIVAIAGGDTFYWEYHEKQHALLSVDRPKYVYTSEGNQVTVPRFFQRLARDIWRALYFRPYTVVWQNWFETSENSAASLELVGGYREFHLDSKFSFDEFLSING